MTRKEEPRMTRAKILRMVEALFSNLEGQGTQHVIRSKRHFRRVGCPPKKNEKHAFVVWLHSKKRWERGETRGGKEYAPPLTVIEVAVLMRRTEVEVQRWIEKGFPTPCSRFDNLLN